MMAQRFLRPDVPHRFRLPPTVRRVLPGIAICAAGSLMLALAKAQPAWVGADIGPGLMAQLLGAGVIGLGAVWAVLCALAPAAPVAPAGCGHDRGAPGLPQSGPALCGAVLAFGLALPLAGLVVSAGLAATLAAWGAGERAPRALAATVGGLMALVAAIGTLLLPPTAPLWPLG